MRGEEKAMVLVVLFACLTLCTVGTLIYRGHSNAQQTNRACIAAGGDVVLDNCIRRKL